MNSRINNFLVDNCQDSSMFYIQITFYANYSEEDVWVYYG